MAFFDISKKMFATMGHGSLVKKTRINSILEPFQCMLQLALVSTCPIKTKLSIINNILYIQEPNLTQGVQRWFQQDNKTDLLHLFTACQHFSHMYKTKLKRIVSSKDGVNLYDIILQMALDGLDKLISTYSMDISYIPQLLLVYKSMLKTSIENEDTKVSGVYLELSKLYSENELYCHLYLLKMIKNNNQSSKNIIHSTNILNKNKYDEIKKIIRKHLNSI